MIIVCQSCSTRLQVDDEKSPGRPFNVRCPKCNNTVNSGPANPASEQSALAIGGSPSTERRKYEPATPAPVFEPEGSDSSSRPASSPDEALRLIASLLAKGSDLAAESPNTRPSWNPRKALLCTIETHRELLARKLADLGYQVFVAEDTRQAVERMRANPIDVVVLDPQFDTTEQGATFVVREINVLRPSQRRRLFFVLLSPSLRTMDAHSAFLNNVNAIVNVNDVEDLARITELALRDFNELYSDFNRALKLTAI